MTTVPTELPYEIMERDGQRFALVPIKDHCDLGQPHGWKVETEYDIASRELRMAVHAHLVAAMTIPMSELSTPEGRTMLSKQMGVVVAMEFLQEAIPCHMPEVEALTLNALKTVCGVEQ